MGVPAAVLPPGQPVQRDFSGEPGHLDRPLPGDLAPTLDTDRERGHGAESALREGSTVRFPHREDSAVLRRPSHHSVPAATAAIIALATISAPLVGAPAVVAAPADPVVVVDDFEYTSGLPVGNDGDGTPIGFYTFQGSGSSIGISTEATPPAPTLPEVGAPNRVLSMNIVPGSFAGYIHAFENESVDTWVTQDWSASQGISFWFKGTNSGAAMFIDVLDNRNPGSTKDDAERWTAGFTDDFDGWKQYEFPFDSLTRKEVSNGAPNDGLDLFEVHGYAFGATGKVPLQTFYFDQVALYGTAPVPPLKVTFAVNNSKVEEGTTGEVAVKLNRPFRAEDPDQVSVRYATEEEGSIAIAGREYTPASGTLTFAKNDDEREQAFSIETFDDTKWEGDERIVLRLTDFVGVAPGGPSDTSVQGSVFIADNDKYQERLVDDFERGAYLWSGDPSLSISAPDDQGDRPAGPAGAGCRRGRHGREHSNLLRCEGQHLQEGQRGYHCSLAEHAGLRRHQGRPRRRQVRYGCRGTHERSVQHPDSPRGRRQRGRSSRT